MLLNNRFEFITSNRTNLELKLIFTSLDNRGIHPSNRTNLELKPIEHHLARAACWGF